MSTREPTAGQEQETLPSGQSSVGADLQPGQAVGEYRVEGKIGAGGFGAVYRAVHPIIGKSAAIKVLHKQYSANSEMMSRFVAEARAVNQIRHRNIIDIFSFGFLDDGRQYCLMEYLEGVPLDEYLQTKGRLSMVEALPILKGVARALDAAHAAGIVHRDLKPENVFLTFDEEGTIFPKLLDFGIAKLLDEQGLGHKTATGVPIGTPFYMSPEQCRGKAVDHRTDIYSFGVLVYELLTGNLPFRASNVLDIYIKHTWELPQRPSEACPQVPAWLDGPVLEFLEKEPSRRPSSLQAGLASLIEAARLDQGSTSGARASGPRIDATTPGGVVVRADASTLLAMGKADLAQSRSASGRKRLIAALSLPAIVAVVVSLAVASRSRSTHPTAPGVSHVPAAAVSSSRVSPLEPAPKVPTESATVEITVDSIPKLVDVHDGTERIGSSALPLTLARSDSVRRLSFRAPGYAPVELDIRLDQSSRVAVRLVKLTVAPTRRSEVEF